MRATFFLFTVLFGNGVKGVLSPGPTLVGSSFVVTSTHTHNTDTFLHAQAHVSRTHGHPTSNAGMQNGSCSLNTYTLHTRFWRAWRRLACSRSVLSSKISASELRRNFIKSALLVGQACLRARRFVSFSLPPPLSHPSTVCTCPPSIIRKPWYRTETDRTCLQIGWLAREWKRHLVITRHT